MAVTFAHHETLPHPISASRIQPPCPGCQTCDGACKAYHAATGTCCGPQTGGQACSSSAGQSGNETLGCASHSSGKTRNKTCRNSSQTCNSHTSTHRCQTNPASAYSSHRETGDTSCQTRGSSTKACDTRACCGRQTTATEASRDFS
jgi:hypothetical protein